MNSTLTQDPWRIKFILKILSNYFSFGKFFLEKQQIKILIWYKDTNWKKKKKLTKEWRVEKLIILVDFKRQIREIINFFSSQVNSYSVFLRELANLLSS